MAPMAYSRMFSFRMKRRAAPRSRGTASVFASSSRLGSELARLERAPRASFATLRSSFVRHFASVATTSCGTPLSPSCTRRSGAEARFPKTPQASFRSTELPPKARMAAMVASTKPRLMMSSRYCAWRLRPLTMPMAASWRLQSSMFACSTAASEESQPEASNVSWTCVQSWEQAQIAEATFARVLVITELLKAAMSASTPPRCRTAMQQSSLTQKLLRKRHTATTREALLMHLFSTSTMSEMPSQSLMPRRCRVRLAMSARAVIASSMTPGLSPCLRRRSTTRATEPRRLMMVSELSTTLSVARTSKQYLIIAASDPPCCLRRSVVVDSRPFWMAMLSVDES
mmetsp:Transcript_37862/g.109132  ORF Transcript_37862/g.109132 Transcript_37862/m.109132 type:complete len:343 (-) Transcript_37862:234-1262(-)